MPSACPLPRSAWRCIAAASSSASSTDRREGPMETREGVACTANVEGATLSAWRDGALPPADLERVHAHVTGCSACQARLAQYDELARMLQRQRQLEPGDRIAEAGRKTLAHPTPRPS